MTERGLIPQIRDLKGSKIFNSQPFTGKFFVIYYRSKILIIFISSMNKNLKSDIEEHSDPTPHF